MNHTENKTNSTTTPKKENVLASIFSMQKNAATTFDTDAEFSLPKSVTSFNARSLLKNLKRLGKQYLVQKELDSEESERSSLLFLSYLISLESPAEFILKENELLPRSQRHLYFQFLRRRAAREPLAYILTETDFLDFTLTVTDACLIPRPETELLVEKILDIFKEEKRPLRFLDIGTGSGNIAIALVRGGDSPSHSYNSISRYSVDAVDISDAALHCAKINAERLVPQKNSVRFFKSNLFESIAPKDQYDAIVANLPYLSEAEFSDVAKELHFEPKTALVSGVTGLELITTVIQKSPRYLKPGGKLFLEIGYRQGKEVVALLAENNFQEIHLEQDWGGLDRIVWGSTK